MNNSAETAETTLDYIDHIVVPGRPLEHPANEYWQLICMRDGMEFLYQQVRKCEQAVLRGIPEQMAEGHFTIGGNHPLFRGLPLALVTCSFHWYSISACQYARLVGAIAYRQNQGRAMPLDYVKSVLPEVLPFRDKVAAHFAWATKNKKDNRAERKSSVFPSIRFSGDTFRIAGWQTTTMSTKGSSTGLVPEWSLSEVHTRLTIRYWPKSQEVLEAVHPT